MYFRTSGEGKTTICDLITNLIQPDEGEILINGVKNSDISSKSFKKMISFVTQKPFFNGKVKESLCYGIQEDLLTDINFDQNLIEILKLQN